MDTKGKKAGLKVLSRLKGKMARSKFAKLTGRKIERQDVGTVQKLRNMIKTVKEGKKFKCDFLDNIKEQKNTYGFYDKFKAMRDDSVKLKMTEEQRVSLTCLSDF